MITALLISSQIVRSSPPEMCLFLFRVWVCAWWCDIFAQDSNNLDSHPRNHQWSNIVDVGVWDVNYLLYLDFDSDSDSGHHPHHHLVLYMLIAMITSLTVATAALFENLTIVFYFFYIRFFWLGCRAYSYTYWSLFICFEVSLLSFWSQSMNWCLVTNTNWLNFCLTQAIKVAL